MSDGYENDAYGIDGYESDDMADEESAPAQERTFAALSPTGAAVSPGPGGAGHG